MERPLISVIVPTRNEEEFIGALLDCFAQQTYDGPFEVLVLDGGSTDRTCEIVKEHAGRHDWVRLIDNPGRTQARAFNLGMRSARGDVIGYVGAHSEVATDFLEQVVRALEESGAAAVGGTWTISAKNAQSEGIAIAMNSPFGPGTADYRWRTEGTDTDTVLYGFYLRGPLEEVGGLDESLHVNEDYELNVRLRQNGHRLYYSPAIRIKYFCRSSVRRLWRQYLRYGFWKARVVQLHPGSLQVRHLAAPLLTAGILVGLPLAMIGPPWTWLYLGGLATYLLASLWFSTKLALRHGLRFLPVLPVVFATLHIGWGAGFFAGAWHWWIRGDRPPEPPPSETGTTDYHPAATGKSGSSG